MVDAVKSAGGRIRFTIYPQDGDEVCGRQYETDALFDWLLQQKLGAPSQPVGLELVPVVSKR